MSQPHAQIVFIFDWNMIGGESYLFIKFKNKGPPSAHMPHKVVNSCMKTTEAISLNGTFGQIISPTLNINTLVH